MAADGAARPFSPPLGFPIRGIDSCSAGVGLTSQLLKQSLLSRLPSEDSMSWKAPKVAEVAVGMEINMYACAWRAPKVAEVAVGMEINMYACAQRK